MNREKMMSDEVWLVEQFVVQVTRVDTCINIKKDRGDILVRRSRISRFSISRTSQIITKVILYRLTKKARV